MVRLIPMLGQVALFFVDMTLGTPLSIFILAAIPAVFCAIVRRLHDLGKSGWWYLIVLIPLIGAFIVLYWFVSEGEDNANYYGDVPTNTI